MDSHLPITCLACLLAALTFTSSARAEAVTYDKAMAAIQATQTEEQSPAEPWDHEPKALRAALVKRPPNPG